DYEGAISCYRELIKANPKDFLAKNNKAYLLSAINKQHDEALKDLHEAEYAFGRRPTLLDTQAQVFIAKEDPKAAIPLLEEVIEQDPRGSYYFHLAQAYVLANDLDNAKRAWKTATEKYHLKAADLHKLEQEQYDTLAKKFSPR